MRGHLTAQIAQSIRSARNYVFPLRVITASAIGGILSRFCVQLLPFLKKLIFEEKTVLQTGNKDDRAYPKELQAAELGLLRKRRGLGANASIENQVGFGLSGGGIRSATFCLGVFQGLAKQKTDAAGEKTPGASLLSKIDYLSTVSGGGYFGAFYGRLFTREQVSGVRAVDKILAVSAASKEDRGTTNPNELPRGKVFRWLRENGRYLAPNGAGDVLLGGSGIIRNLIAVQVVLGTFILMIFLAAQLIRAVVEVYFGAQLEWDFLQNILHNNLPWAKGVIWWSPYAVLPAAIFLFFAIPPAWCYWLVEKPNPTTAGDWWLPPFWGWFATVFFCALGIFAGTDLIPAPVLFLALVIALETMIWGLISGYVPRVWGVPKGSNEKLISDNERLRLRLSKQLKTALIATGAVLAFVVIDSLAQTVYGAGLMGQFRPGIWLTTIFGPLIGIASFGRRILSALSTKADGKRFSVPVKLLTGAAAFIVCVIVLVTLDAFAYLIAWQSKMPLGPRADWITAQKLTDAKKIEVRPISAVAAKPPDCHYGTTRQIETTGEVISVNAEANALTIRTNQGDLNLAAGAAPVKATVSQIKIGDRIRVSYITDRAGKIVATSITVQTAGEGWQISAEKPELSTFECGARASTNDLNVTTWALILTAIFSVLFGWSWPFLNRSTHQPLYTSRLVRAYLGASNMARMKEDGDSVTEAAPGDDIPQEEYWPRFKWLKTQDDAAFEKICNDESRLLSKGMPLHLVNVTINETLDALSQVEQQDRKGIGMAVGPTGISAGVFHHLVLGNGANAAKELSVRVYPQSGDQDQKPHQVFRSPFTGEFLTLGNWTGISGAAFSTSLGWRTSLGLSLLAGLANVRLTYWWNSGVKPTQAGFPKTWWRRVLSKVFQFLFTVQSYLFDELLARYHGTGRQWWPLSDGGHFENMGGYELIRRRLPVIVIIDAEEDSEYTFEGLANFVRKARLDFGAEIKFLTEDELDKRLHSAIRRNFGTLEQLRRGVWMEEPVQDPNAPGDNKTVRRRRSINPVNVDALSLAHAALADVFYDNRQTPESTILYIKPTLIGDESPDVHRYHSEHPAFPQEPTLQQFFDEAQWESYRKLGEHIATKVFQKPEERIHDPEKFVPFHLLTRGNFRDRSSQI